ncbi:outer membrane protein [Hyphomicrobium facile]|uniref:Outer membrane immunogenic protein n=1 Tax=Hyphomicrobium facile TaxID=51670 RepID=A0A1I7NWR6_9HYPH|nr:outer membrane beta-barrel protein [Hyphomicrobium facile]SFV39105.1 outer membrane immunogenic protein [Hyphomicrobium facile]
MRKSVALVAFILFQSTGAFAGGSLKDAPAPIPPPADGWSGFSVGAGIGGVSIDQNASAAAKRTDIFCLYWWGCSYPKDDYLSGGMNDDAWKVFGTVQVGYDRLLGDRILIGAFADYDFYPNGDESSSGSTKHGSLSGELNRAGVWTVGGRLGVLVRPDLLVYGLGGFSRMNQNGEVTAEFDNFKLPTSVTLKAGDLDGWTVGGGIETKLDRIDKRLSLKVEYRYSQFDGESGSGSDKSEAYKWWVLHCANEKARFDIDDATVQSVRAVLVWKLQADATPIEPLK